MSFRPIPIPIVKTWTNNLLPIAMNEVEGRFLPCRDPCTRKVMAKWWQNLFGHDYFFAITIAENGEPFVREARCLQFNSSLLRQIKKRNKMRTFVAFFLARPKELESPTFCSGGRRSIQLSYGRIRIKLLLWWSAVNPCKIRLFRHFWGHKTTYHS